MKPKIRVLITEPDIFNNLNIKKTFPKNWECNFQSFKNTNDLISHTSVNNYEVVFAKIGLHFNKHFFSVNSSLRLLGTPTTGIDHIDLLEAENRGVIVISLRGHLKFLRTITSTAEHAWSLLLACNRSLFPIISDTKMGDWSRGKHDLNQLSGKVLGIIGFGRLGEIISKYGISFGMKVHTYDPHKARKDVPRDIIFHKDLDDLLVESDHIILCASYNIGDSPILDTNEIYKIKKGAALINISRGELINESALIEAFKKGIIRSMGLDVLSGDSVWSNDDKKSSELLDFAKTTNKIIITPHIGGYAQEAIESTRIYLIELAKKYTDQYRNNP